MLQSRVKEKEMLTLMQISELKILVVLVIGSFFVFEKSFFNHRLVKEVYSSSSSLSTRARMCLAISLPLLLSNFFALFLLFLPW